MYVKLNTARSYTYNVARAVDNGIFASKVSSVTHYLHQEVMFFACVCLVGLQNYSQMLWMNFHDIFKRGTPLDEKQLIIFGCPLGVDPRYFILLNIAK